MTDPDEKRKLLAELVKQQAALRSAHLMAPQYSLEAYRFVCEGVNYTCEKLGGRRDVSGRELLDGLCELALDQFGFLARRVFEHWGITTTDAFGDIVFNLVEAGLLGRSPRDHKADFHNVFDLRDALDNRYQIRLAEEAQPTLGQSLWPYEEPPE